MSVLEVFAGLSVQWILVDGRCPTHKTWTQSDDCMCWTSHSIPSVILRYAASYVKGEYIQCIYIHAFHA